MDTLTLEKQSWQLFTKIQTVILKESNSVESLRFKRLSHSLFRSYERYQRRQQKLFNYHPDGFAPSPVQPSGVVGQGALI